MRVDLGTLLDNWGGVQAGSWKDSGLFSGRRLLKPSKSSFFLGGSVVFPPPELKTLCLESSRCTRRGSSGGIPGTVWELHEWAWGGHCGTSASVRRTFAAHRRPEACRKRIFQLRWRPRGRSRPDFVKLFTDFPSILHVFRSKFQASPENWKG